MKRAQRWRFVAAMMLTIASCFAFALPASAACSPSNGLRIRATDSRFVVAGHARPGLITITFANDGRYTHEMSLARLRPGVTLAQFEVALASADPESAVAKLVIDPNDEISGPIPLAGHRWDTVTVPLPAGHYVATSFLPGPAGVPQDLLGLVNEFTLRGPLSATHPRAVDGTVVLTDHSIRLPREFARGGTFAVHNAGHVPHDLALLRLGRTGPTGFIRCLDHSFVTNTPVDRCSGRINGGISEIPAHTTDFLTIHLRPGRYADFSTAGAGPTVDIKAGLNGRFTVT